MVLVADCTELAMQQHAADSHQISVADLSSAACTVWCMHQCAADSAGASIAEVSNVKDQVVQC